MSTAYPPRLIKYALSSKKERSAATSSASSMIPGNYGHFPDSFTFYYAGPGQDFLSQRFFFRDISDEHKKLYAITYFKGPGECQMTLYSTEQHAPPVLAISASEKRFSNSVVVTAPPSTSTSLSGFQTVHAKHNMRQKAHRFTIPAGGRGRQMHESVDNKHESDKSASDEDSVYEEGKETYEWREDSKIKPKIRRLVRLASKGRGEEQIAMWKEGSTPSRAGRLATFEFDSRDTKNKLGDYGALVAISSVLAICGILGAGVDGCAAWQQEKALEKGYHVDYWENEGSELAASSTSPAAWSDPYIVHRGKPEELVKY